MSFCFLYNVVSENYSVQNSPWGEGVYSQLKFYIENTNNAVPECPGVIRLTNVELLPLDYGSCISKVHGAL